MSNLIDTEITLLVSDSEFPRSTSIWGTGGWAPPAQREALDWLTLLYLMGWKIKVVQLHQLNENTALLEHSQRVIVACDPHELPERICTCLESKLNSESIVIIARAGNKESPSDDLWGTAKRQDVVVGRDLYWSGPGQTRKLKSRADLRVPVLDAKPGFEVWATLSNKPIITTHRFGKGFIVTLSFHPSEMRDRDGTMTALLKHLLVWSSGEKSECLDFSGCMILRMDDPGGSQNVFSRDWAHQKISRKQWADLGLDLKRRQGSLSIGYVAGWVDDGDSRRGCLHVAGQCPPRVPGKTYPSPFVKYEDLHGHLPGTVHDYSEEYQSIKQLLDQGIVDIALHGYTHINPDTSAWAQATDRYDCIDWYRELGKAAAEAIIHRSEREHPLNLGMAAINKLFGIRPSTLICPGDEWTDEALEHAVKLGLQLVSSYYLALRHEDHLCWTTHVCAPYLDEPDSRWFDAELPVIGYFHDRDIAIHGTEWFITHLNQWQEAGAKMFIDFKQFTSLLKRS
jgi:hypothetical protein